MLKANLFDYCYRIATCTLKGFTQSATRFCEGEPNMLVLGLAAFSLVPPFFLECCGRQFCFEVYLDSKSA